MTDAAIPTCRAGADPLTTPIRNIVIVGRDVEAWVAALALRRTLGPRSVSVTVLEIPSQLLASDVVTAVPAVDSLHRVLGIETLKVAQACAGVPMAGQRFSNWSRSAPPFIHAYGPDNGNPDPPLLHYWVKARQQGLEVAFDKFSLVAAAAREGRIATPAAIEGQCPLPGYQFDARRYAGLWKRLALASGVSHREGRLAEVERDDRGIAAIQWEGGERFTADLYIDASGAEAILASAMPGAKLESWAHWFPGDRIISTSAPALSPLPPFAQISAFRAGWVGLHPLQDRTAVTGAVASRFADEEMLGGLAAIAGAPIHGDVTLTQFTPGHRTDPWIANCIALGRTSLELEPLDSVQLHYLHLGLSQLVTIFETSVDPLGGAEPYNQAMRGYARNLRDFQLAHYRLNQRFDEPMWDEVRDRDGPDELESRIEEFSQSADVAMQAYESFARENWATVFVGHGLVPRSYDSWVDEMKTEDHMAMMQDCLSRIAQQVRRFPSVETFLGRANRAPRPAEA